jgi:hypothetical protein
MAKRANTDKLWRPRHSRRVVTTLLAAVVVTVLNLGFPYWLRAELRVECFGCQHPGESISEAPGP